MKLRILFTVLFVLACAHARADDADDCAKSGDTAIPACTRAIARIFTQKAWYLVYAPLDGLNHRTIAGPFSSQPECQSRNLELGKNWERDKYICLILSEPLASDV